MRIGTMVQRGGVALGITLTALYALGMAWAFESQSYNVWGSMLIAPLLWAANAILIWQVGKREDDKWIVRLLGIGFAAKMLGSFARYFMVFVLYDGVGDATGYNLYAVRQYLLWRQGMFVWEPAGKIGTQNLELITTGVYTIIGPAPLAGFLVFACMAYWGCYLLYRAFRVAVPDGAHRLYAVLVFLLPSLLFWPSSIGKEAWLLLFVGVFALAIAKFFQQQRGAIVLLIVGVVGTALVRPHITVLLTVGVLVAQLFRPVRGEAIGLIGKAIGVAATIGAIAILATQSAEFLGIEDLNPENVLTTIDWAGGQTMTGGSEFTPVPLSNPLGIPAAIATILFRPFPWEASSPVMFLQSAEGVFVMGLCWRQRSRLRQLLRQMRTNPYVTFAVFYALAFTLAFAGFSNFGIIARQRTLMLPLFAVLLALPKPDEIRTQQPATDSLVSSRT
ncbi:MAG: hypothetical protein ACOX61_04450 [Brooklawnia sp.]|jgi:hypothetical protein